MRKRIFVSAVLLFATIMLVTSCKNSANNDEMSNSFKDGVFVPSKELGITVWYTQGTEFVPGEKLEENVVEDWVYNKTKVKVENIYGNDGGQWDVKLSRLIAGNNLPEVITCGSGQGASHFAKLAEVDMVWEITEEMLGEYAPNVLKRVPPDMLEAFKVGGKLYGIPYGFNSNEITQPFMAEEQLKKVNENIISQQKDENMALWIRDDILKKLYPEAKGWNEIVELYNRINGSLGDELLDIPIFTTKQYIDVMYKIKQMDLKANGKPVYAFGYSGGDNWEALSYLGGDMMGYKTHYYTSSWNPITKEIRIPLLEDTIKQAAKIQNKMLRDEVIDPESLVHTTQSFKEKVLNGQYAICPIGLAGGGQTVNSYLEKAGIDYRYRPFVVNIENKEEYAAGIIPFKWSSSIAFLKNLKEKEVIQLLNWVNVTFSDEFEEVYLWGPKDAGLYTETKEGKRFFKDERFNERFINGKTSALDNSETMGLATSGTVGTWYCNAVAANQMRWAPGIYNDDYKMPIYTAITRFSSDSPHINLPEYPPFNVWEACFAGIDEVVTFWAQREQWEQQFKIAFSASTDESFELKWQEAIDNLNRIVDTDIMRGKMTDAALREFNQFKNND